MTVPQYASSRHCNTLFLELQDPQPPYEQWTLHTSLLYQKGRDDQRDNRHKFDQNVHRRAGGVLERVAHGVAHHSRLMSGRALSPEIAFLDILLRIVPRRAACGQTQG